VRTRRAIAERWPIGSMTTVGADPFAGIDAHRVKPSDQPIVYLYGKAATSLPLGNPLPYGSKSVASSM
jgi:hypothetical protein